MKFKEQIESLIENRHKIPDEFWVQTGGRMYQAIWFMDRQKPSVEQSYDFAEERFGLTKDGKIIWGFDSGCSCPSPWSQDDFGDQNYSIKEWKEFEVDPEKSFDADWEDECYRNMNDYLLLIQDRTDVPDILKAQNAEVRRYLLKRVGYENVLKHTEVESLHVDGTSELLNINGEKYVKVKDHSTDREYLLYVPSNITRCKEGIAWTFGLREEDYNPVLET